MKLKKKKIVFTKIQFTQYFCVPQNNKKKAQ